MTLGHASTPSRLRRIVALGLAGVLAACSSSTTPSGSTSISSFDSSATASDGTTAVSQTGTPPAANGGPSITVTSGSSVVAGTKNVVRIQATQAYQTIFASVAGVDGFLKLTLSAPTTDSTLVIVLSNALQAGNFTAQYSVAAANGTVGASATVATSATTVVSASSNITGTWASGGTPVVTLSQSGSTVTGSEIFSGTAGTGVTFSGTINGTVSGNVFTGVNVLAVSSSGVSCTRTDGIVTQISGTTMTGTYTAGTLTCTGANPSAPTPLPFTITLTKQ
jgi:hypothetical protein